MQGVGYYNQERHVQTDFDDFTLFKPLAWLLWSLILIAPLPWAICHLNRVMMGGMSIPGMGRLQFDGKPTDRAVLFYTLAAGFSWVPYLVETNPTALLLNSAAWVLSAAAGYVYLQWLYVHISIVNIPMHMRFTGKIPAFVGLTLLLHPPLYLLAVVPDPIPWLWGCGGLFLLGLGFLTKIWGQWLFANLSGPVKLTLTASVWDITWRLWLVIATIPFILPTMWSFSWFTNWFICQIGVGNQGAGTAGSR